MCINVKLHLFLVFSFIGFLVLCLADWRCNIYNSCLMNLLHVNLYSAIDRRVVSPHIYLFILPFYPKNFFFLFDKSIQSTDFHFFIFSGSFNQPTSSVFKKVEESVIFGLNLIPEFVGGRLISWLISGYNSNLWMINHHFAHFYFRH